MQRDDNDGSNDYQFWARDSANNAMGNMGVGAKIWPIDAMVSAPDGTNNQSITQTSGGSQLQLFAMRTTNPQYPQVMLAWPDANTPQASFDTTPGAAPGGNCMFSGTATNGAVTYFQCWFPC